MVSTSFVVLGGVALLGSTAMARSTFIARIPNAGNVEGYAAIGHTDPSGGRDATNAFGSAFGKASAIWTVALCKADSDGDGQTNGQELGDPCCVWTQKSGAAPQRTTGISHPSEKTLIADPTLWANVSCDAVSTDTTATDAPTSNTTTTTSSADDSKLPHLLASTIALATVIALISV